jgi:hypothetical protein
MSLLKRNNMKKIITILAILGLVSCGGGSNNDQGTSITLIGYVDDCTAGAVPNIAGASIPLSTDSEPATFAGGLLVGMVINNNLSKQFIRTENAFFTYFIPGATTQPPATSTVAGSVIAAAGDAGGTTSGCVETFIVPAEIRQWLVLNRNFLPEPPFSMEVDGYVTAISQAGDRFDTNEVKFLVQITPDVEIPPAGADGGGDTGAPADTVEEGDTSGEALGGSDSTGDTSTGDTGNTGDTSGDSQL